LLAEHPSLPMLAATPLGTKADLSVVGTADDGQVQVWPHCLGCLYSQRMPSGLQCIVAGEASGSACSLYSASFSMPSRNPCLGVTSILEGY
jgi:hypothetical protein